MIPVNFFVRRSTRGWGSTRVAYVPAAPQSPTLADGLVGKEAVLSTPRAKDAPTAFSSQVRRRLNNLFNFAEL